MPWKVSDVYDQRVRFVSAALRGDLSLAAVCRAYGISRETGYKWIERYHRLGWAGLGDASRAPHHQARAMAPDVAAAIVALRRAHPFWGPKKLRAVLDREHPGVVWPALSTIGDLLHREGLIMPEPCPFLRSDFPPVSIIRPTQTVGAATAFLKALIADGLFIGQSKQFFEFLEDLAEAADAARRVVSPLRARSRSEVHGRAACGARKLTSVRATAWASPYCSG